MTRESKALARICVGVAVSAFAAIGAYAAERHPCSKVMDDTARLACYDAVFGTPATAPAPVAPTAQATTVVTDSTDDAAAATTSTAAAVATAAGRGDPVSSFGEEQIRRPQPATPREPVENISSIARSVSKRPYGELVVELENGQTWVQQEADSSVRIKPGDPVVIERAALGSYKLVSGTNATRVKRVK